VPAIFIFKAALELRQGGFLRNSRKRERAGIRALVSTLPDYAVSGVKAEAFVRFLFFLSPLRSQYQ